AHSEGFGYFTYIAYDALNKTSCVENPLPNLSSGERVAPIVAIKGIEVEKERSEKEIYVEFRLDLYAPFEIYFTAEGNGEKYEKKFLDGINYVETDNIFYGPATMIFPLSDLVPGLNGENFDDYVFTMTIKNTTAMEKQFLDAEEIILVNEYDGTESLVTENSDIRIEPLEERNIPLIQNTFVYYLGYDNVTLHYRTDDGEFKSAPMEKGKYQFFDLVDRPAPFSDISRYSYKYYLEGISEAEIYFTDDEGHVDDNNGQYYKPVTGNNFYFTEGLRDPLTISEITLTNGTPDVGKKSFFDVEYSGGYAPYHIICYATNLDTGEEDQYSVAFDQYRPYYNFKKAGNYRISVHVQDFKGDVVSSAIEVKVVDNPFAMTTTADKNECFVSEPINFESVTSFENFDISKDSITSSAKYVVKNSENKVMWEETIVTDDVDTSANTSTSRFTYFPRLSGDYTLTVTKKDSNKETVENTVEFTVLNKLIGDADGDGLVTIIDATYVQRVAAQMTFDAKFYEVLADADNDSEISVMDATYIQRYVAELNDYENVGKTTEYVTPKNTITFTNNLGWDLVYCHYTCKDKLEKVNWPGVSMVKIGVNEKGEDIYSLEIPQSTLKLCFTNNAAETLYIDFNGTDKNYTAIDNGTGSFYEIIEI
ncbi:MAG: starch-binding protein, partial [Ruminococcus sp.]|nr:starch-binding protein [Ruminococcus sp.]